MDVKKQSALDAIDRVSDIICHLSDAIWDTPETAYQESHATKLQCAVLEQLGFQVERNLAGIPTAFSGRWGSGKPVIGILGEFDALSGLSQKAGVAVKEPVACGGNGHGCGHNLLGAGSIAAAYGVQQYLRATGKSGTVIYFGCPGEEGGSGKAFMARDGVFDGLDCAISWHPQDYTTTWCATTLANYQVNYKFRGRSAHAAAAPHLGRSALDAVELMNVGVQFLREHVIPEVRIHYAITNTGGFSPNVVQPNAEVLYLIRAPKTPEVQEVYERVNDIARGAALMTGTEVEIQFIKACSNYVMNDVMADTLDRNLHEIPVPAYSQEELAFARSICASLEKQVNPMSTLLPHLRPDEAAWARSQPAGPMCAFVVPRIRGEYILPGSTDVGDVSWVCPTGQISVASWAAGTPGHSWQVVAQGKGGIAHKSLLYAGKVMAGAAIDLLNSPEQLVKAREELDEHLGHQPFVSPIPRDVKPAAIGPKP